MPEPVIRSVVVSGYVGSGKDAVGALMQAFGGYRRYAYANPLRKLLERINPMILVPAKTVYLINEIATRARHDNKHWAGTRIWVSLQNALQIYGGWDALKREVPETRELMQRLGHGARDIMGRGIWAQVIARNIYEDARVLGKCPAYVVITDQRQLFEPTEMFLELQRLWRPYGLTVSEPFRVWVDRPGLAPVNDADSEKYYDEIRKRANATIYNHTDIASLKDATRRLVELLEGL